MRNALTACYALCIIAVMDQIFAYWPSIGALAEDIGEKYPTVAAWKQRGNIPAHKDTKIVAAAKGRGFPISYETLAHERAAEAKRKKAAEGSSTAAA